MLVSAAAPMALAERLSRREWGGRNGQVHSANAFVATMLSEIKHGIRRPGLRAFGGANDVALLDIEILRRKAATMETLVDALAPVLVRDGRVLLIVDLPRAPRWLRQLVERLETLVPRPARSSEPRRATP